MPPKAVHPILIQNAAYRRACIRHCTAQIREIEGRLEQGCGTRFEQQLQSCDDLNSVARLLLQLQRRADMKDVENGWLEELTTIKPDDLDERCIEMVRAPSSSPRSLPHLACVPLSQPRASSTPRRCDISRTA